MRKVSVFETDFGLTFNYVPRSLSVSDIVDSFNRQHQQRFGFISDREIELVAARMEGNKIGLRLPKTISIKNFTSPQSFTEQMIAIKNLETGCIEYERTPVFDRESLKAGDTVLYGKYSGTEISFEDQDYLIMRESDVVAII